jgi:hypothetical protein
MEATVRRQVLYQEGNRSGSGNHFILERTQPGSSAVVACVIREGGRCLLPSKINLQPLEQALCL